MFVPVLEFLSGVALAVAPVKDQFFRLKEARQVAQAKGSKFAVWRAVVSKEWRKRRDSYDNWDAICTVGGALGLGIVLVLKALGYH